jgi:HlyD family secretion protein/adhesin transport system membrane fusion protein
VSWRNHTASELDAKTLTLPLALEKEHPPQLYSFVVTGILMFVAGFIAWAFLTTIIEVTHAKGNIQPSEHLKTVQHLDGGYIAEIMVDAGDVVDKGDPILRLVPTNSESDRDQLEIRLATLKMNIASLDAQAKGHAMPDFSGIGEKYPEIARQQLNAFSFEQARIKRELAKFASQLARRELEYQAALAEQKSVAKRLEIAKKRFDSVSELARKGFAATKDLLAVEADLEDAKARELSLKAKIATAAEMETEARFFLEEQQASIQASIAKQLAAGNAELAEMEKIMVKYQTTVDDLLVSAPIDGIVQQMNHHTVGAVVRPGEVIATIVPNDRDLIAEVRVDPKDIGHVNVGADAKITVSTYDPFSFGNLTGEVKSISETSHSENGRAFFKVEVALDQTALEKNGVSYPIHSGMEVTADIVTGEKSLAKYLLKPVFRSLDQAFSER